jgi:hypothetical protein
MPFVCQFPQLYVEDACVFRSAGKLIVEQNETAIPALCDFAVLLY